MLSIGIDLGGTKTNFGLIEIQETKFEIRKKITIPSPQQKEGLISALYKNVRKVWDQGAERIGLAEAGQIDFEKKMSICSPNIKILEKVSLAKLLEKKFNLPVHLNNDANAFTLAESIYGAGKDKKKIVGLTLGTGIGGGVILNHELYHGAFTSASEFGHMIIQADGRPCSCGKAGCLEAYASGTAIVLEYERRTGFRRDAVNIEKEAKSSLEPAKSVFLEAASYLAVGLANIINIFEPEVIILGGGLSRNNNFINSAIKKTKKITAGKIGEKVKIVKASLGTDAGMIGAALL